MNIKMYVTKINHIMYLKCKHDITPRFIRFLFGDVYFYHDFFVLRTYNLLLALRCDGNRARALLILAQSCMSKCSNTRDQNGFRGFYLFHRCRCKNVTIVREKYPFSFVLSTLNIRIHLRSELFMITALEHTQFLSIIINSMHFNLHI